MEKYSVRQDIFHQTLTDKIIEIWDKAGIKKAGKGIVLPDSNDNEKEGCLLWIAHKLIILVSNSKCLTSDMT